MLLCDQLAMILLRPCSVVSSASSSCMISKQAGNFLDNINPAVINLPILMNAG